MQSHSHPKLNQNQRGILKEFLKAPFEEILELPSKYDVVFALQLIFAEHLTPHCAAYLKELGVFEYIEQLRQIIAHPCPQNRTTGYPYLDGVNSDGVQVVTLPDGRKESRVYVYSREKKFHTYYEIQGLLSLTQWDELKKPVEPLVDKKAVIDYLQAAVQTHLAPLEKETAQEYRMLGDLSPDVLQAYCRSRIYLEPGRCVRLLADPVLKNKLIDPVFILCANPDITKAALNNLVITTALDKSAIIRLYQFMTTIDIEECINILINPVLMQKLTNDDQLQLIQHNLEVAKAIYKRGVPFIKSQKTELLFNVCMACAKQLPKLCLNVLLNDVLRQKLTDAQQANIINASKLGITLAEKGADTWLLFGETSLVAICRQVEEKNPGDIIPILEHAGVKKIISAEVYAQLSLNALRQSELKRNVALAPMKTSKSKHVFHVFNGIRRDPDRTAYDYGTVFTSRQHNPQPPAPACETVDSIANHHGWLSNESVIRLPDGNLLIGGDADGQLKMINHLTGSIVKSFSQGQFSIKHLALVNDHTVAASDYSSDKIIFFDLRDGSVVRTIDDGSWKYGLFFVNDVLIVWSDSLIKLYNFQLSPTISHPTTILPFGNQREAKPIREMIILNDNNILVVGRENNITKWKVYSPQGRLIEERILPELRGIELSGIQALTQCTNGNIVIGYEAKKVTIYNLNGNLINTFTATARINTINCITSLTNGNFLISSGPNIEEYDSTRGALLSSYRVPGVTYKISKSALQMVHALLSPAPRPAPRP